MDSLIQIINNDFSVQVIGLLNDRLEDISGLVSANMKPGIYEEIADEVTDRLVASSKDFFMQGFLRGMAAAEGGIL